MLVKRTTFSKTLDNLWPKSFYKNENFDKQKYLKIEIFDKI